MRLAFLAGVRELMSSYARLCRMESRSRVSHERLNRSLFKKLLAPFTALLLLGAGAASTGGCELLSTIDRSKIDQAAGGRGGGATASSTASGTGGSTTGGGMGGQGG